MCLFLIKLCTRMLQGNPICALLNFLLLHISYCLMLPCEAVFAAGGNSYFMSNTVIVVVVVVVV